MRILHVADLHQGMQSNSWPDPATGIPSRLLDVAGCWIYTATKAVDEAVDAVVVAGDIFHAANPDAVSLAWFRRGLNILAAARMPVLLLAGNHDRAPHPGRPSVLEAFQGDLVTVVTEPGVYEVRGIRFACLPSVSRHQLMTAKHAGRYVLQADVDLVDGLRSILDALRATGADVLVAHWPVAGSMLGLEKDIAIIPEPMLAPQDIEGPWRYAALGHIHRRQLHAQPSPITSYAYSGSIDRMNFGEEGEPKGGAIVDTSNGIEWKAFDTPARKFLTIDLDEAKEGFHRDDVEDVIIRLRGDHLAWIGKVDEIRTILRDLGAASVRLDLQRVTRVAVRSAAAADAPGPLEALDAYLEHREVPEDDRPPIRARAHDLLEGSH